jgi:acetyltransferase-like isoleucine patch superfamily enzyme
LQIGFGTYGFPVVINYKGVYKSKIVIGKFCSIGENVRIMIGGEHNTSWVSTYPFRIKFSMSTAYEDGQPFSRGDVNIKNDVWIGRDVLIRDGVNIGSGAIIGAGAVVTKDVPSYSIVVGNPINIIRFRFSETQIEELLKIEWWNWPLEKILANVYLLSNSKVEEFIELYKIK